MPINLSSTCNTHKTGWREHMLLANFEFTNVKTEQVVMVFLLWGHIRWKWADPENLQISILSG
jgi:hypothetical protein